MSLETMAERNKDCNKEMKVKNKERGLTLEYNTPMCHDDCVLSF